MVKLNKKLTFAALVVFASNALATSECECNSNRVKLSSCEAQQEPTPTWWNWLTKNNYSQLHFFQLVELMHTSEVEVRTNAALIAKEEDKAI